LQTISECSTIGKDFIRGSDIEPRIKCTSSIKHPRPRKPAVRNHSSIPDPTVADEIKLRSVERDLDGRTFTVDQVDGLLAAAGSPPSDREHSYWPARDVAIVSVLASCGLRISELCNLTPRAFDTTGEQAVFRLKSTKGGKGRVIPIPARTVHAIERYLTERTEHATLAPAVALKPKGRLFVRNDGQPQTQAGIDRQLRRHCALAGV
jgi:site-specific recombinase XerD